MSTRLPATKFLPLMAMYEDDLCKVLQHKYTLPDLAEFGATRRQSRIWPITRRTNRMSGK